MRISLKTNFIVFFLGVEIVFLTLVLFMNFRTLEYSANNLSNEKFTNAGKLFTKIIVNPVISYDIAALDDALESFSKLNDVLAVRVVDKNKETLSSYIKDTEHFKEDYHVVFKEETVQETFRSDYYELRNIPIVVREESLGKVYILFDKSNIVKLINTNKSSSYQVFLMALLIAFIVSYYLGNKLSISLKKASDIAKNILSEKKDVTISLHSSQGDEVNELFKALHEMKTKIEDRTSDLNSTLLGLEQFILALNHSAIVTKIDLSRNITYVNDKFIEISAYSREELIGKPHSLTRSLDMDKKLLHEMWKLLEKKKVFKGTIKHSKKSGESYYVDSTVVPLLDKENSILEYIAISYDVTDLVNARNQALNAERVKSDFLSNMSHEIRTPLNAILGFIHILQSKLEEKENLEYLKIVEESSQTLLLVINDILDFSKINSGELAIDKHQFLPHDSFKYTYELFRLKAEEQKLHYIFEIDDNVPMKLFGDILRIQQIVYNLLSNAFKFTIEGGSITLKISYDEQHEILEASVADEGLGISKKAQKHIFDAFKQADTSTTRKYGGTGLGLSISSRLAELMDGRIDLESKEGEGSTFTLCVKVEKAKDESSEDIAIKQDDQDMTFDGNILVAEDNMTNQALIKILLKDYSLDYTVVSNGEEALEAYKNGSFDMILMDENMPVMNGIVAVEKIRAYEKENGLKAVSIIAVTANVLKEDQERFKDAGMNDFVAKPIEPSELERVFRAFL